MSALSVKSSHRDKTARIKNENVSTSRIARRDQNIVIDGRTGIKKLQVPERL